MSKAETVTTENATTQELAQLNEEMRARVQMQDIERSTVAPGKIMVPVKAVATSDENDQISIRVEHPIDGEVSFYLDKPRTWNPENELVEFLTWYDLTINGIYQLQTHDVCIERDDSVKGWHLCKPPSYTPPRGERARERLPDIPEKLHILAFVAIITTVMLTGLTTGVALHLYPASDTIDAALAGWLVGVVAAVVATAITLGFGEVHDE